MKFFVAICAAIFLQAAYVDASDGASDNATVTDQNFKLTILRKEGSAYEQEHFGLKITHKVGNISLENFEWPYFFLDCPPNCRAYYAEKAQLKVNGLDPTYCPTSRPNDEIDQNPKVSPDQWLKWDQIAQNFSLATTSSSRICTYDCDREGAINTPDYMLGYFVANMTVDTSKTLDIDKDKFNTFSGMVFGVGFQKHSCALNLWVGSTYGKEGSDPTMNNCISDLSPYLESGPPRLRCRSGKNQIFTFQYSGKQDQIIWYPK